jgi:hypothetical protein
MTYLNDDYIFIIYQILNNIIYLKIYVILYLKMENHI